MKQKGLYYRSKSGDVIILCTRSQNDITDTDLQGVVVWLSDSKEHTRNGRCIGDMGYSWANDYFVPQKIELDVKLKFID